MDAQTPPQTRLWNKRFIQLVCIEVLFQFAAYLTNPVVSVFALTLGASVAIGGILAGLTASMALFARPFTGWLADKMNKKLLLFISAIMFGAACFGCAFSTSVGPVALFRVLQGFAFAFKSAVLVSLVTLSVPKGCIGRAVGWTGLAQTVSCALGPMLGSLVVAQAGYAASFFCAGSLFIIAIVLIGAFQEPKAAEAPTAADSERSHSSSQQSADHNPAAHESTASADTSVSRKKRFSLRSFIYMPNISVTLMAGLTIVPHGVTITMLMTVGEMKGIAGISFYYAVYAFAAFVAKPLAGRLTDQYGTRFVLIPALVIEIAATIFLAFASNLGMVIIAAALMGIGQGSAYAALQAESVRGVAAHELGRASNTFYIGTDIGMGFGPMAEGVVLEHFGVAAMFLSCSALIVTALAILLFKREKEANKPELLGD